MNLTSLLLDFLLSLLRDPEAAAEFNADPEGTLEKAGLGDVECEDVDTVLPVILDYAPVVGEREYDTGGNHVEGGNAGGGGGHHGGGHNGGGHHGGGNSAGGDHAHAVQQIHHIVKNYSYTEVDDRDTITDLSTNQNIWANGDVVQWFDNDAIVASGDHAVAAGDDAWVDNSEDNSTNVDVEVDIEAGEDIIIGDDNDETNTTVIGSEDVAVGSENSANDVELDFEYTEIDAENSAVTTGDGDAEYESESTEIDAENSAVNTGEDGEAEYTEIDAEDSAVATDGSEAAYIDASTEFDDFTAIDADQSVVAVEDGRGDAEAEVDAEIEDNFVIVVPPGGTLE